MRLGLILFGGRVIWITPSLVIFSNFYVHNISRETNENTFASNRSYYICLQTKQQLLPRYFLSDLPQLPTMNLYNISILFSAIAFGTITAENALLGNENSTTIHQRIRNERRFVLFNSRRLSGDCCKFRHCLILSLRSYL